MSTAGFALVLAAAFCHATWNLFVKRLNAGAELVWLFSLVSVVIYAPLAIWLAFGWETFALRDLWFIAGSTVLHLGYFLLLQKAYSVGDLSVVYPTARATGPVLSGSFAVLVLGEALSGQMALGAGIIVAGVFMLTGGRRSLSGGAGATSLLFGMATGALIGAYTVWDAYAVTAILIPPLILEYASNLSRLVLLTPVAWLRRARVARLWREERLGVLVIAVLSPLAYILVLIALRFTPVVYVAPLREVSVLLSVLAGSLILGEGDLKRRLIWAMVILTGVSLLATS
ncbi:DMT family transporter [Roseivivax sp. THAF197b]|uniref:DMT family transporter n=1 Tax=Roseivivax sp. THAF197b TaxID=2588299 RepID=UPI00126904B7|nr:DMT family transporter [Roseivivax sp. THAF197b]QFS82761.1 EamA-like transporter family protein [Roseivivax sp. THAF197b]